MTTPQETAARLVAAVIAGTYGKPDDPVSDTAPLAVEIVDTPDDPPLTANDIRGQLIEHEKAFLALLRDIKRNGVPANTRWLSVARTHFQQGAMALTRALYRPHED